MSVKENVDTINKVLGLIQNIVTIGFGEDSEIQEHFTIVKDAIENKVDQWSKLWV